MWRKKDFGQMRHLTISFQDENIYDRVSISIISVLPHLYNLFDFQIANWKKRAIQMIVILECNI